MWLKYQVGLFARTLSTLLKGGLPLVPSLEVAARSIGSRQISNAVFAGVETVREGKGLSKSLEATKVFPELATEMIEVGESTGALPADAELGSGVLRGGRADQPDRGDEPDRAGGS